jgi:hypothetical protein
VLPLFSKPTGSDLQHEVRMSNGDKPINRLNDREKFRLVQWLESQKERILKDQPTLDRVADEATAALGFRVLASNVHAARNILELSWTPKRQAVRRGQQHDRVRVLARAVIHLYVQLGLNVSDALRQVADGRGPQAPAAAGNGSPGQAVPPQP